MFRLFVVLFIITCVSYGKSPKSASDPKPLIMTADLKKLLKSPASTAGYKCTISNDQLSKKVFVHYRPGEESKYVMSIHDFVNENHVSVLGAVFGGLQFNHFSIKGNATDQTMAGTGILFLARGADYDGDDSDEILSIEGRVTLDNSTKTADIEYRLLKKYTDGTINESGFFVFARIEDCIEFKAIL